MTPPRTPRQQLGYSDGLKGLSLVEIAVRLPKDHHERLKALAQAQKVSLNKLCRAALEGVEVELFEAERQSQ